MIKEFVVLLQRYAIKIEVNDMIMTIILKKSMFFGEEEDQYFVIDVIFILQFHKTFNITE